MIDEVGFNFLYFSLLFLVLLLFSKKHTIQKNRVMIYFSPELSVQKKKKTIIKNRIHTEFSRYPKSKVGNLITPVKKNYRKTLIFFLNKPYYN